MRDFEQSGNASRYQKFKFRLGLIIEAFSQFKGGSIVMFTDPQMHCQYNLSLDWCPNRNVRYLNNQ